jgi:hypothetical protein
MLKNKNKFINILNNSIFQFFLISGLVWLVFVNLHINKYLEDIILGPHYWRKSDTYAQILNYYYNGLNFFDHSIYFNQMNSNGKAVAEFPLFYYFIAIQLKIFGNYPLIIKANWIIVLMIGIFSIFKITYHFTKNYLIGILISMLLFLSPVFCFYSVDYLPDPIALSLGFFGLWLLIKNYQTNKKSTLYLSLSFITFSGMIKPFYLIPYIAFLCTVTLNQFIIKKTSLKLKWGNAIPFVFVGLWFFYVSWYNYKVRSHYFLSSTKPIWNYSIIESDKIFTRLIDYWFADIINPTFFKVSVLILLVNLMWWKNKWVLINSYLIFSFFGITFYFFIMFGMLKQHDYYVLPILFFFILNVVIFLYKINFVISNKITTYGFTLFLLFLVFLGLDYSFDKLQIRRNVEWRNSKRVLKEYYHLDYFLTKNRVMPQNYVVAFSDPSPSYALSTINRKGWSNFQIKFKSKSLDEMINKGAEFLLLNEVSTLSKSDSLIIRQYKNYYIDDTNHIFLYDLRPYKSKNN